MADAKSCCRCRATPHTHRSRSIDGCACRARCTNGPSVPVQSPFATAVRPTSRGGRGLRAQIRCRRAGHLRRHRRALGRRADGRAHERARRLQRTIETGEAWYFSRSRRALWRKGEDLRPRAAGRRDARRLRPGRGVDQGRAGRAPAPAIPAGARAFIARCRSARAARSGWNFATARRRSIRTPSTGRSSAGQGTTAASARSRCGRACQQSPGAFEVRAIVHHAVDADGRLRRDCHRRRPRSARALATAAGVGVNTSLMTATCAGWIAILPVKPSRRASSVSRRSAATLRKSTATVSIACTCAAAAPGKAKRCAPADRGRGSGPRGRGSLLRRARRTGLRRPRSALRAARSRRDRCRRETAPSRSPSRCATILM